MAGFSSITQTSLQLEQVKVMELFDVIKDNYLRKTGALVTDKQNGEKKILIRLNAREFKNESHRQALVKVVTFMTSQHRLPCLVQYDRFLRDDNDFYLIHENYQYGRLKDLLNAAKSKGKPFSEQFIKNWLGHLLVAVNALHERKVPHLNINILNIYVDEKRLNLGPTDGFSRILDHPRSFAGGQFEAKPNPELDAEKLEYTAPELIAKKVPGPPVDIWSIGIVAYYLGAMKYPFHHDDPDQVASTVLRTQPDYNVFTRHGYSQGLKEFVECCLCKDLAKRPTANQICQHPYILDDFMRVRTKTMNDGS